MRIVIFDDLPEGGAKRVVFEQIKGLSQDHTVDYITNTLPTRFPFDRTAHEVFRFDLDDADYGGWLRPLKEFAFYTKMMPAYRRIAQLIDQIDPDVVIVHPSRFCQAPPLLSLLKQPSVYFAEEWLRVVYEPELHKLPDNPGKKHYEMLRRTWLKQIDRTAVCAATTVCVTSAYVQTCFEKAYRRDTAIVPLGVNATIFCPGNNTDTPRHFLFIGEPEAVNGYPLLEAVGKTFSRKWPVKLVRFDKKGFRYSDAALVRLYRQSFAALCLAEHEPFGLVALEAMAAGVPVIAVNEGGYRDTVVNNRTGILVDRNEKQLYEAMTRLAEKADVRIRMGKAGRSRALRQFTWEQHILRLERVIDGLRHG